MNQFSRRDILSTAAVAGGVLSASMARAADQPSREPGIGGTDPVPGDVVQVTADSRCFLGGNCEAHARRVGAKQQTPETARVSPRTMAQKITW